MKLRPNLLFRLFPPPRYLSLPFVGFDISDQSVKFVELKFNQGVVGLGRYADIKVPAGLIEDGRIIGRDKFKDILKKFRLDHDLLNVVVSLPEEQAFIVHLEVPNVKKSELRESIELQLEEHVPLEASDMVFDYEILDSPTAQDPNYQVSISILPKSMVTSYYEVLKAAGYNPIAFEIEGQALARALVPKDHRGAYLITDIGKMRTSFAVVINGVVTFTSTVAHIGGADITKSIAKNLAIEPEEAEKLKIKKGLLRSADNRELFYALIPVISSLADEIRRVSEYWKTHADSHQQGKFDKIILTGGQSTLPGLTDYLSANLALPVEVGNPWSNILSFADAIPELDYNNAERYATALGLSLRGLI